MHSGVMSLIFVLQEGFWKRLDASALVDFVCAQQVVSWGLSLQQNVYVMLVILKYASII